MADGFSAARYHAGLEPEPRRQSQDAFLYDRVQVMVATNAFGMGIDKSNVNFVIHYNMPLDLESYYQEAGRAGRDGQPADCILLYSPGDVRMGNFLIDNSSPAEGEAEDAEVLKDRQRERLKQMTFYCHSRYCLRGEVLRYFGQAQPFASCGACSVCAPDACRAPVAGLAARPARRAAPPDERDLDQALLAQLKALRKTLAARAGVPAFVVFTDATLRAMCARPIRTRQELLQVPGVGVRKCESYGDEFLELLRRHADPRQ